MNVRKYQPQDRDQVLQLWQEIFADTAPHNQPAFMLDEKLKVDDLVFVAEAEDVITGACIAGYDGHRGWLYSIAVSPSRRLSGTGRALVDFALASLHTLGCAKVNLQIRGSNPDVADFYRTIGFEIEDRISMGIRLNSTDN